MIKIPIIIEHKLKQMPLSQVQFFANLAQKKEFEDVFIPWCQQFSLEEKDIVFNMSESDERKLVTEKAFSRGKVASITELVYTIRGSVQELERRSNG